MILRGPDSYGWQWETERARAFAAALTRVPEGVEKLLDEFGTQIVAQCRYGTGHQWDAHTRLLQAIAALTPPRPVVPEELREAAEALLNACERDFGLEDDDVDDEPVASGLRPDEHGRPFETAVKFGHMRRLRKALAQAATAPAPAQAVAGTEAIAVLREIEAKATHCPVCRSCLGISRICHEPVEHAPDCRLAAAIASTPGRTEGE